MLRRVSLLVLCSLVLGLLSSPGTADRAPRQVDLVIEGLGVRMPTTLVRAADPAERSVVVFLPGEPSRGEPMQQARELGLLDPALGANVVVLDSGPERVCAQCGWVDAGGGGPRVASFVSSVVLHRLRHQFGLGTSRDERALVGLGSGGTGALLIAFDHSDTIGTVAAAAPTLDLTSGLPAAVEQRLLLAGVGYGAQTSEATLRDLDPRETASQALGTGLDVLVAVAGADVEPGISRTADAVSAVWGQLGLAHQLVRGRAGEAATAVFRRSSARQVAHGLERRHARPVEVSLRSSRRQLAGWGWRFVVTRSNEELFTASGARTDGTRAILAGTGRVQVTTPAAFAPRSRHTVVLTRDPASEDPRPPGVLMNPLRPEARAVVADATGRLSFSVALGPERDEDETRAAGALGRWSLPHVTVEVDPAKRRSPAPESRPPAWTYREPASLPAPFSSWGVNVSPATLRNPGKDDHVLSVRFPSRVLGALTGSARVPTETYVFLPDAYFRTSRRLPVLYFLHGTGSGWANLAFSPERHLARSGFVVVVPDMGVTDRSFCKACDWVDAREMDPTDAPNAFPPAYSTATELASAVDPEAEATSNAQDPVMAERHLYEEVLPLMERMFRIRTDREGRAVDGDSMGAGGALIQAYRHPDIFGFAGALSGTLTVSDPTKDTTVLSWFSYLSNQGYPVTPQRQILYRGISVDETATNAIGSGLRTLVTNGDGCTDGAGWCGQPTTAYNTEAGMRRANDPIAVRWAEAGVAFSYMTYHGEHYRPDVETYAKWHLPLVEAAFAGPDPLPQSFSYKSIDPSFRVWGYDVKTSRPNVEFLCLNGARVDGTDFTLHGTGTVTVSTPATFRPGERRRVRTSHAAGGETTTLVTADARGRLTVTVSLGGERFGDEQLPLLVRGEWPSYQARVTVLGR